MRPSFRRSSDLRSAQDFGLNGSNKNEVDGRIHFQELLITSFLIVCYFANSATIFFHVSAETPPPLLDPIVFYTMELVCAEGYHIQEHKVVTEDGFILTVFRIPNAKRRAKIKNRMHHYQKVHYGTHPDFAECLNDSLKESPNGPAILLGHGLLAASDCWVLQGEKFDLAYLLADQGFDVWFANIRGNFYSRKHKNLNPSDRMFWDFSFHENGVYDLPAIIDYILQDRRHKNLIYVGHSMGTTMYFIMISEKPAYNDKIKLFVALTPVGHIKNEHYAPNMLGSLYTLIAIAKAVERRGVFEILPRSMILTLLSRGLCGKGSIVQNYCNDIIFAIVGYHSKLFFRDKISLYLSHGTSGNSVKTIVHYGQLLSSPTFRRYNYSLDENFNRYGQAEPPNYDLTRVKTPTAFYYSTDDYIAAIKNVRELISIMPNLIEHHEFSKLSHLDFVWAYTAKDLIYPKIIELLKKFRN